MCLIAHGWTKVLLMTWWASIASWFLTAYVGTELNLFCTTSIGFDECGGFVPTAETPSYWLLLLVCSVVALGRHYAWNQYQRMIFPDLYQILLEVSFKILFKIDLTVLLEMEATRTTRARHRSTRLAPARRY